MEEATNLPSPPHLGLGKECEISIDLFTEAGVVQRLAFLFNYVEVGMWLRSHDHTYLDPQLFAGISMTWHSWDGFKFRDIPAEDWNNGLRWDLD